MSPEEKAAGDQWDRIVARARTDANFKRRLISDPTSVAADHDIRIAPGVEIRVVENTATVLHLVIPSSIAEGALSEEELGAVAGGVSQGPGKQVNDSLGGGNEVLWQFKKSTPGP